MLHVTSFQAWHVNFEAFATRTDVKICTHGVKGKGKPSQVVVDCVSSNDLGWRMLAFEICFWHGEGVV